MSCNKLCCAGEVKNWLKIVTCARNGIELVKRIAAVVPAGNWYMHGIYGFWAGQVARLPQRRVLALRGNSIPTMAAHLSARSMAVRPRRVAAVFGDSCAKRTAVQWNGKELLQRDVFGCQIFVAYGALGKGRNQLSSFFFAFGRICSEVYQTGGRSLISLEPSALCCCSCQCTASTKEMFWSWRIRRFHQASSWRCVVSRALAPRPVTKAQCIWWSLSVCPSLQREGEKNPSLLLRRLWTSSIMTSIYYWAS